MDAIAAQKDLEFIKSIVRMTSNRVDAQAFHFIHWGLIVLVWYPLGNWLWLENRHVSYMVTGALAFLIGACLSIVGGVRSMRHSRLPAGNTVLTRQLSAITLANVIAGALISSLAPIAGVIRPEDIPIVWGVVYANMAFMIGVAYSRDFAISGAAIFVGCVIAMFASKYNGFVLGPFMGFGMLIPGVRAELRVRRLLEQSDAPLIE